jgi:hypothetical protein
MLEHDAGFTFLQSDVTDHWTFLVASTPCSTLLPQPVQPTTWHDHLETLAVGSSGTRLTLDLARAKGARYLLASTSEIYGDPLTRESMRLPSLTRCVVAERSWRAVKRSNSNSLRRLRCCYARPRSDLVRRPLSDVGLSARFGRSRFLA